MKQEILQLTGGKNSTKKRRELDFYPTPNEVTVALMNFLKLDVNKVIWECASGNGQMTNALRTFGNKVIETDIITGQDFLKTKIVADAIITNPPFNLSDLFIQKAVQDAKVVAMLLKSQYWHAKKRLALFKKYPPAWVLPLTWRPDFLEHERINNVKGKPTMEVAWSVWINVIVGQNGTRYMPLEKPVNKACFK